MNRRNSSSSTYGANRNHQTVYRSAPLSVGVAKIRRSRSGILPGIFMARGVTSHCSCPHYYPSRFVFDCACLRLSLQLSHSAKYIHLLERPYVVLRFFRLQYTYQTGHSDAGLCTSNRSGPPTTPTVIYTLRFYLLMPFQFFFFTTR